MRIIILSIYQLTAVSIANRIHKNVHYYLKFIPFNNTSADLHIKLYSNCFKTDKFEMVICMPLLTRCRICVKLLDRTIWKKTPQITCLWIEHIVKQKHFSLLYHYHHLILFKCMTLQKRITYQHWNNTNKMEYLDIIIWFQSFIH